MFKAILLINEFDRNFVPKKVSANLFKINPSGWSHTRIQSKENIFYKWVILVFFARPSD